MKFPKIDLKELEKEKERNRKNRLEFVKLYAEWLKKTPNKIWSKQQNKFLNK
ncbi:hypothetical protein KKG83_08160 [Candidatus Micrarchaeota archaeon]|nr:hypothetical protein [Candidatus Micrarchaeota archaeon]MBU2477415.1 hypothetical protein [Candidatus Micrarchaeota archaeon]